MNLPMSLRTAGCEMNYQHAKDEGLTQPLELTDALKIFKHWRIIENDFCYCVGYERSHMLIIKRGGCADYFDLNADEKAEFDQLKRDHIYDNYDQIIENCPHRRSVPRIFHYHLINFYKTRGEMKL